MKNITIILIVFMFTVIAGLHPASASEEKWEGVDVAVIEKTADEQGHAAAETPFNSLEGDLLLFAFLLGGAIGGFCAGYYYRKLTEPGAIEAAEEEIEGNVSTH